jgi:hypothetical protein
VHRSIDEDAAATTQWQAMWWSTFDSNNIVDLEAPAPAPTPANAVKTEDNEESNDFDFGSSYEGDDVVNLDLSAFYRSSLD